LKEIITETNILIDKDGMKIITLDSTKNVLVHLKLYADKFESYYCDSTYVIGLNIINMHKILKTMNNNDSLTLYMEKRDKNKLIIKIENSEKET
jgi:DNA polymerase III sliding clamp (beta) subunit (PCNA family)